MDHPQNRTSAPRADASLPPLGPQIGDQLRSLFAELREIREILANQRKPNLTVGEVALLVGRDPYTVRTWVKTGRLKAIRVLGTGPRGRLLIERSELDRLLADGRGGSVPDADVP